jgi:hypothetical protein
MGDIVMNQNPMKKLLRQLGPNGLLLQVLNQSLHIHHGITLLIQQIFPLPLLLQVLTSQHGEGFLRHQALIHLHALLQYGLQLLCLQQVGVRRW